MPKYAPNKDSIAERLEALEERLNSEAWNDLPTEVASLRNDMVDLRRDLSDLSRQHEELKREFRNLSSVVLGDPEPELEEDEDEDDPQPKVKDYVIVAYPTKKRVGPDKKPIKFFEENEDDGIDSGEWTTSLSRATTYSDFALASQVVKALDIPNGYNRIQVKELDEHGQIS